MQILTAKKRARGAVVGILTGFDKAGNPLVRSDDSDEIVMARTAISLDESHIGRDVVMLLEKGNARKPIVLGVLRSPLDVERKTIAAKQEIVLRCGKASITLTRAGKVLIRGAYLLSRSSGVNRIQGGSVQIN